MNKPLEGKRVLAVIYGAELFGSERANLEALQSMQRMGAAILVGVSAREPGGGDVGDFARNAGFETFLLPFGSHFAYSWMRHDRAYRNRQLKRLWTNSRALHQAIKQFGPTHLMFSTVLSSIFVSLALVWHRTPLIYRIGDAPVVQSKFQLFFWRRLIRRATHIVCISDFIVQEVMAHSDVSKNKVSRIYNVPITRPGKADANTIESLKAHKRPLQLVYVGQIGEQKGVSILVHALIAANDSRIGAWIVGGSAHTEKLEAELKTAVRKSKTNTSIRFEGFQADPRPYYAAADWHIAPSVYQEPLGNIVQEAKIAGIPSIISNNGGLPELIADGIDGVVLSEVDSETIQQAFENLLNQPENWKDMGNAARKSLHPQFTHATFDADWGNVVLTTK
jgi:glycosyltransferase involved in cell wall biosynthesis